jgi:OmpA-OmpF porin, OOP family
MVYASMTSDFYTMINWLNVRILTLTWALVMGVTVYGYAQINLQRKLDEAKSKVEQRVNRKIDNAVDKTLDNMEHDISGTGRDSAPSPAEAPPAAKPVPAAQPVTTDKSGQPEKRGDAKLTYISRFDFIPGENILWVESFEQAALGDFPEFWDTDASGEIVQVNGVDGRWLRLGKDGFFLPLAFERLPDNYTLEFDVIASDNYSWFSPGLQIRITDSEKSSAWRPDKRGYTSSGFVLKLEPVNASSTGGTGEVTMFVKGKEVLSSAQSQSMLTTARGASQKSTRVRISLWKQGQRIRVYLNEQKVWDLPRAFEKDVSYDKFFFVTREIRESESFFVGNFKLADGTPDTRSKLISEGSLTTHGITFDVNSDAIKYESYGVIRDIAAVLLENPGVRVKIIGHTDSDGSAALNKDLSLRRAVSVQKTLADEFKIDKGRLEVEGRGSEEPIAGNDNALNKALNRRVQFLKL